MPGGIAKPLERLSLDRAVSPRSRPPGTSAAHRQCTECRKLDERCGAAGFDGVVVVGHPEYYPRFAAPKWLGTILKRFGMAPKQLGATLSPSE